MKRFTITPLSVLLARRFIAGLRRRIKGFQTPFLIKDHVINVLIVLLILSVTACNQSQPPVNEGENLDNYNGHKFQGFPVNPVIGAWFWGEEEFDSNGYTSFIDHAKINSPYNLLTVSIRVDGKEMTNADTHDQVKLAVEYAKKQGVEMALDLDVRLARRAFEAKYPDELQDILRLQEIELSGDTCHKSIIYSTDLTDHMTGGITHYIPLKGSLRRVYSYNKTIDGIDPNSLKDITSECAVLSSSKDSMVVSIPPNIQNAQSWACVMVSFTHLTPDVFAPHLIDFQREIIYSYSDVLMAGGMKDEWGFPPSKLPLENQFWYSEYRAEAYSERTSGRELLSDCLLMYIGIKGRESERQLAINHLMEMNWQRNGALEDDFYNTVKEVFGPEAAVVTHATWYAYLCTREYKKNGLSWWASTRDWAQTDEEASFAVRTSLAKKWGSPVWYNQFYAEDIESYKKEVWSSALAGGRVNYHPIYPNNTGSDGHIELLRGKLMRGEARVRLLNYITKSPLNCPVAVIFGHPGIMNWAGDTYDDPGIMDLVNKLWSQGVPTDLIPSSEIETNNLVIAEDGRITYGSQSYSAIVLYNPEFEKESTADFFSRASKGSTRMFQIGDWTKDFNGRYFDGNEALSNSMLCYTSHTSILKEIKKILKNQDINPQTPATLLTDRIIPPLIIHPSTGLSRLIDGTIIQIAGSNNVEGDPIISSIDLQGMDVYFDAIGVAAVRINKEGQLQAMAAGGLKSFKAGTFEITLEERLDIAIWLNEKGEWEGVIQGCSEKIPSQLLLITKNWNQLSLPFPL